MIEEIKKVQFKEDTPKYKCIGLRIKELIDNNIIKDGEKLPSIRELKEALNVNKVTIINAYNYLLNKGYATSKMGSGTFAKRSDGLTKFRNIYSRGFKVLNEGFIDFTGETTNEVLFPIKDFKNIINKVLDRDGEEVLLTQDTLGYEPLRKTINNVFWDNTLNTEDILIVSGAQQGIDIASKSLLTVNDNVVVEKPTYGGALSVFKWKRANIFEVPIEEDGIDIEKFERILKKNKISLFYTMSYFQNPTGVSYSLEKKKKILDLASKYDFYIIEDDYLSELIYEESLEYIPFKYLDREDRVIYIKSFSKIFLPGVRLGYIIPPKVYHDNFFKAKFNTDISTASLMQRALEYYIANCNWRGNIHTLSVEYKKRYNLMGKLIKEELKDYIDFKMPSGGLNFYLRLKNDKMSSRELYFKLRKRNVFITPGVLFFRDADEGDLAFRIGFSQTDEEKIIKGLKIIKEELDKWHI